MFVLGIDIGKDDLYVYLLETTAESPSRAKGQVRVFPNSFVGHQSLQDWLSVERALPHCTSVVDLLRKWGGRLAGMMALRYEQALKLNATDVRRRTGVDLETLAEMEAVLHDREASKRKLRARRQCRWARNFC